MQKEKTTTFSYAKDFADRIAQTNVNGVPLGEYRILGHFSFTPFQTTATIFSLIGSSTSKQVRHSRITTLRLLATTIGAVLRDMVMRPRVLVYGIDKISCHNDHDARMAGVHHYLAEQNVSKGELLHTLVHETFLHNLQTRRRGAMYTEVADILFSFVDRFHRPKQIDIDLSLFTEDEQGEARRHIQARLVSMRRTTFHIRFWKLILGLTKPRVLFAIDDMRQSAVLTAAARMSGIPVYWFQHGHYTKYHAGLLGEKSDATPSPDGLVVWSEYWKAVLESLGTYLPSSRILIGSTLTALPELQRPHTSVRTSLVVLIPYETVANKEEVRTYIGTILAEEGTQILFKIRNDIPAAPQLAEYGLSESPRLQCITDISEHLSSIDVVAGTYSTLLYDLVGQGIPVALLETDSDFGMGMVEQGIAKLIRKNADVIEELRAVAGISEHARQTIRDHLYGKAPVSLATTLGQILVRLGIVKGNDSVA